MCLDCLPWQGGGILSLAIEKTWLVHEVQAREIGVPSMQMFSSNTMGMQGDFLSFSNDVLHNNKLFPTMSSQSSSFDLVGHSPAPSPC